MILFLDYQAIVVQLHIMDKRKSCSVKYCRHVYATTHKLIDKRYVCQLLRLNICNL